METLTNAEAKVQPKLEQFARTSVKYELLVTARKLASSLNPRGDNQATSSVLAQRSLRLQLKVLLALAKARDPLYEARIAREFCRTKSRGQNHHQNGFG